MHLMKLQYPANTIFQLSDKVQKKCKMFRVYCKKATTSMGRGIVYKIIELFLHAKLGFKRYNSSSTLLQI